MRVHAEHGLREAEVEVADEIEPVAHEALVRAHVHAHVEIARRRAELARVPVAGQAHGLAVVDARRDVDAELAPLRAAAAAAAVGAGALGDAPAPAAVAAGHRAHELAERRAHDLAHLAGALALAAGQHLGALGGAVALADLAGA